MNQQEIIEIIKSLVLLAEQLEDDYSSIVRAIAYIFPSEWVEQLVQLVDGPVWDGDILAKPHCDILIAMGIATHICYRGEGAFTGARHIGLSILWEIRRQTMQKNLALWRGPNREEPVTTG